MDCILKPRRLRHGRRKTSVKITVSADLPSENGSYCPSCESRNSSESQKTSHEVLKEIIIEEDSHGANNKCESSNDATTRTRVTVDDSIVDYPSCIDFGIQDFLCCKDEIDPELYNSDTDNSFLDATPPHRFSDSELESQIEIMSITLDTVLNLGGSTPVSEWANRSMSKDDIFTVDLRVEHVEDEGSGDPQINESLENQKMANEGSASDKPGIPENDMGKHATVDKFLEDRRTLNQQIKTDHIPPNKRPPPPMRPFRRQISLPASIFMSYLLAAEKNLASKSEAHKKTEISGMLTNNRLKKLNYNNTNGNRLRLSKIDGSYPSSTESTEEVDQDEEKSPAEMETRSLVSFDDSSLSLSSSSTTPIYINGDEFSLGRNENYVKDQSSIGERMSLDEGHAENVRADSPAAFTSEIERRSLLLRYMRRLIRQDTSTNFAPNDYCI